MAFTAAAFAAIKANVAKVTEAGEKERWQANIDLWPAKARWQVDRDLWQVVIDRARAGK